ncbi:MAG TPA: hypothetical protein VJL82_10650 [Rhizomicrobium sp.]|nr:hypothetical protein [Rhizomicrobium sp.]
MARAPIPPQDLFVVRTLSVIDSIDKVRVEVGVPKYVSDSEAVCPYSFTYQDRVFAHDTHGLDAFQALQLAMKSLPGELRHNKHLPIGRMYWLEPGDDMGFSEKDGWQWPDEGEAQ